MREERGGGKGEKGRKGGGKKLPVVSPNTDNFAGGGFD